MFSPPVAKSPKLTVDTQAIIEAINGLKIETQKNNQLTAQLITKTQELIERTY